MIRRSAAPPQAAPLLATREMETTESGPTPRERVLAWRARERAHRERKLSGRSLAKTWLQAWRASRQGAYCPALELTPKQVGQLAGVCRRWPWPPDEAHALVEWVVSDWSAASAQCLGWMKRRPELPSPGILLAHVDGFISEWGRRAREAYLQRDDVAPEEKLPIMSEGRGGPRKTLREWAAGQVHQDGGHDRRA